MQLAVFLTRCRETEILARLEPRARTLGAVALTVLMAGGTLAVMLAPGV